MKNSNILIIEDDKNIRELYKTALEAAGLSVLTAENGEVGLKLALEKHPAVTLLDIMMPGMDGHEVAQKIRLDAWGRHAKIIFLTNFSDAENVVHAVKEGSEKYIVKANTEIKEVVNTVRTAMHTA